MVHDFQPVTRERHGGMRWLRFTSHAFAAEDSAVPLVLHELAQAAVSLPTGFVQEDGRMLLVAVQGLASRSNLMVAADGRWLGGYLPVAYRGYPFRLIRAEDGRRVLCVDEASGLLERVGARGEPFFTTEGELAPPLAEVFAFLRQARAAEDASERACAALERHGVIKPWPIELRPASGPPQAVQGLYRVDESVLDSLSAEALLELRVAGGLKLAYWQLLSMQHLPLLGKLLQRRAEQPAGALPLTPAGDLDLDFLDKGGTISFGDPG